MRRASSPTRARTRLTIAEVCEDLGYFPIYVLRMAHQGSGSPLHQTAQR